MLFPIPKSITYSFVLLTMDHLKETISKLILLEMLFRFVKDHILNRDSDFIYQRFKPIDCLRFRGSCPGSSL